MTRTSRFALLASAIAAALAAGPAAAAAASAADITVQSVTIDPATQMMALQTITTDVRGYDPVVQISAPLAQFVWTVQMKSQSITNPADCTLGGTGWTCQGDLEADGNITIRYRYNGSPVPPGTYTVSASMGNNGVTYHGSGTVTIVGPVPSSGPANPPTSAVAAPTSPPPGAGRPAKGGAPPAPGTRSPASSVDPPAAATAPTATNTPSDPTGVLLPAAATVATQRPGHSGSVTTVAVIAGVVAAAGVAASLFIRRRLRRDRSLQGA
jgi:hypothetical protein